MTGAPGGGGGGAPARPPASSGRRPPDPRSVTRIFRLAGRSSTIKIVATVTSSFSLANTALSASSASGSRGPKRQPSGPVLLLQHRGREEHERDRLEDGI